MTEQNLEITVAPLSEIPLGEGRTFEIAGERIAIFNTRNGQVFAVQADCPHKSGPLADGLIGDGILVCPLHSWKFDLASGEPIVGSCGLKTYSARVDDQERVILTLPLLEAQETAMP